MIIDTNFSYLLKKIFLKISFFITIHQNKNWINIDINLSNKSITKVN